MLTALRCITPPADEPVDVPFIRKHIRSVQSEEDILLVNYISAARQESERMRGEVFIDQTWEVFYSGFPKGRTSLELPIKPVQSVVSIDYIDGAGQGQTFGTLTGSPVAIQEYTLVADENHPFIALNPQYDWPLTSAADHAVRVVITAGYGGPEDVPANLIYGMTLLVAWMDQNREGSEKIPEWITRILATPKVSG